MRLRADGLRQGARAMAGLACAREASPALTDPPRFARPCRRGPTTYYKGLAGQISVDRDLWLDLPPALDALPMTSTTIAPAREAPLYKSLFVQGVVALVLGRRARDALSGNFDRTFSCENQIFVLFRKTRRIEAGLRGTPRRRGDRGEKFLFGFARNPLKSPDSDE
jgi:hypothetical protein